MIRLAVGMLFILINFAPEIGNLSINLLPDFVGYILILSALDKLRTKSPYFQKMSGMLFLLIVYKIVEYILAMFSLNTGIRATILFYAGIAALVLDFIIQYRVFCGIDEIAYGDDVRVNTGRIFVLFKIEVVLAVLAYTNDLYRIYLNYSNTGKIVPGLSIPIFRAFSSLSEGTISVIGTFGMAMILIGIAVRILMIIGIFEVCTDYDKIMTQRSGEKK